MPTVDTQLVDTDVVYCHPDDVFAYIRNKAYADLTADRSSLSQGGLTQEDVDDLIRKVSNKADTFTKRAWRTRKAVDLELDVKFSHQQKHSRHRRRRLRRRNQASANPSSRAMVKLPHNHIKPIDSNEGDAVIILNQRSTNDVTDDEGRDTGSYVISNRKGVLRPDLRLFTPVASAARQGRNLQDGAVAVRISYRYGFPKDVTDYTSGAETFGQSETLSVSTEVPEDIRDAVAMLAVSRLIGSDQYGEVIPNTGDDSPNLSDASSSFKSDAMNDLRQYRRV